jgi:ketosteroid isomerase-like protein
MLHFVFFFCRARMPACGGTYMKRAPLVLLLCFALVSPVLAKTSSSPKSAPDKAYLQKIWDGWSTLNTANVDNFYATGPHVFFDIAPLKYSTWDEYKRGVTQELADYKSAKFTLNSDAELHPAGKYVWGTATVKFEMMHKSGKVDMGDFRWTVVFENQRGKWLVVHEHVSMPIQ